MSTVRNTVETFPKRISNIGQVAAHDNLQTVAHISQLNCAFIYEKYPWVRYPFDSFPQNFIVEEYTRTWDAAGGGGQPNPTSRKPGDGDFSPFDLDFVIQAGLHDRPGTPMLEVLVGVEQRVRNLQAMAFPRTGTRRSLGINVDLNKDTTAIPEIILIVFGSFMIIRGIVTHYRVQWDWPIHPESVRPYGAKMIVTIQPQLTYYPSSLDIQTSGMGVVQSMLKTNGDSGHEMLLEDYFKAHKLA